MNDKKIIKIRKLYQILLSISIIAAGLCLIYGCLTIYYSGEHPYSPQAVSEAFSSICIPVYICLGLTAVSLVFNIVCPAEVNDKIKFSSPKTRLEQIYSKKDFSQCNSETLSDIKRQKSLRLWISALQAVVITAASLVFLYYALDGSHFDSVDINGSMIKAMWVLIPCLAVMLAASIAAEIIRNKSYKREFDVIKSIPSAKKTECDISESEIKSQRKIVIIRCAILLIGICLLVYGLISGGVADVLTKAVNICTECIGLG